jgi:hypothetical protein
MRERYDRRCERLRDVLDDQQCARGVQKGRLKSRRKSLAKSIGLYFELDYPESCSFLDSANLYERCPSIRKGEATRALSTPRQPLTNMKGRTFHAGYQWA